MKWKKDNMSKLTSRVLVPFFSIMLLTLQSCGNATSTPPIPKRTPITFATITPTSIVSVIPITTPNSSPFPTNTSGPQPPYAPISTNTPVPASTNTPIPLPTNTPLPQIQSRNWGDLTGYVATNESSCTHNPTTQYITIYLSSTTPSRAINWNTYIPSGNFTVSLSQGTLSPQQTTKIVITSSDLEPDVVIYFEEYYSVGSTGGSISGWEFDWKGCFG